MSCNFKMSTQRVLLCSQFVERVDGVAHAGYTVLPHYDSMVAKLIVHGADREECMQRARRALYEYRIEGISTTIPFHQRVLDNEQFVAGDYDTHLVAQM